jgi:mycofactocin precursor
MDKQALIEPVSAETKQDADEALADGELLVEEVSIDGMCGVY